MSDYLFVYGSLRKGFSGPQARFLAENARYIGQGHVAGRLYLIGTLADGRSYPGFVPDASARPVFGDLWQMHDAPKLLAYLDNYEEISTPPQATDEYERTLADVTLSATGAVFNAWCYVWQHFHPAAILVPNGDFLH